MNSSSHLQHRPASNESVISRVKGFRETVRKSSERKSIKISPPIVVAYGGGVNSTAMVIEMHRRGIIPLAIVFSDTGAERPETYEAIKTVSSWLTARQMPSIVTVRNPGPTIEEDCKTRETLPPIAFGWKTCSDRWKIRPLNGWITANLSAEKYIKAVGFDLGEDRRVKQSPHPRETNWFPLIEWELWREDCIAICQSENLPAVKSSCFFCPSTKKHEILQLKKDHPELLARALTMEARAQTTLTSVKGLGRSFAWADFVATNDGQVKPFNDHEQPEMPCGCYDGGTD